MIAWSVRGTDQGRVTRRGNNSYTAAVAAVLDATRVVLLSWNRMLPVAEMTMTPSLSMQT